MTKSAIFRPALILTVLHSGNMLRKAERGEAAGGPFGLAQPFASERQVSRGHLPQKRGSRLVRIQVQRHQSVRFFLAFRINLETEAFLGGFLASSGLRGLWKVSRDFITAGTGMVAWP